MVFSSFQKNVLNEKLLGEREGVVVAVSGGIDSMALLDLFSRFSKKHPVKISVAHVNHGLRGPASDADEKFVRKAAARLGLECDVLRKKPHRGKNLQNAARSIRYDFLKKTAVKRNAAAIATAHHEDDQAETILLHLIRGAGLRGLSGMRPASDLGGVRLIRPLLDVSRDAIRKYAKHRGIAYREDASNTKTKYRRNAVRHELVPLLRTLNPGISRALARLGASLADDEKALTAIAAISINEALIGADADAIRFRRDSYVALPAAVRRRIVRGAFERVSGSAMDLNADQVRKIDAIATGQKPEASYRLPSPWKFSREGDVLCIRKCATKCDRDRL